MKKNYDIKNKNFSEILKNDSFFKTNLKSEIKKNYEEFPGLNILSKSKEENNFEKKETPKKEIKIENTEIKKESEPTENKDSFPQNGRPHFTLTFNDKRFKKTEPEYLSKPSPIKSAMSTMNSIPRKMGRGIILEKERVINEEIDLKENPIIKPDRCIISQMEKQTRLEYKEALKLKEEQKLINCVIKWEPEDIDKYTPYISSYNKKVTGTILLNKLIVFRGKEPPFLVISRGGIDLPIFVIRYKEDKIIFEISKKDYKELDYVDEESNWSVQESDEHTNKTLEKALDNLRQLKQSKNFICDVIKGKSLRKIKTNYDFFENNPTIASVIETDKYLKKLNKGQRNVINNIFSEEFTMIQGPPGTGKTTTIAIAAICLLNYIRKIKNEQDSKILVCADSNQAVDNIFEKLLETLESFGLKFRMEVKRLISSSHLKKLKEVEGLVTKNFLKNLYEKSTFPDNTSGGRKFDILCTTLTQAANIDEYNKGRKYKFLYTIIDEASQSVPTQTLSGIRDETEKLVLVGDHKQLGPVFQNREAGELESRSLFEKLIDEGHEFIKLDVQYRMHPLIAEYSQRKFYDGKLGNGVFDYQRGLWMKYPDIFKKGPLTFINVRGVEENYENSYVNYEEIDLVKKVVDTLVDSWTEDYAKVGVISMYNSQVGMLKLERNGVVNEGLKIATVDSFQGSEKDFIIISTVRSNDSGSIGFLSDEKRLNVALTRAKHGIIIIGNLHTLKFNETFSEIIKHFKENGSIIEGGIFN